MARTIARNDPARQLAEAERAWRDARRMVGAGAAERIRDTAVDYVIAARLAGRYKEAALAAKEAADVLSRSGAPTSSSSSSFSASPSSAAGSGSGPNASHAPFAALVEAHACMSALDAGDFDAAEKWLGSARARNARDDESVAALCRAEGNVHLARRRWHDAATAFTRGLPAIHDVLERTIALYNIGEANIRLHKFAEAKKLFLEACLEKEKQDDKWGLSYCYWGIGYCEHQLGRHTDALQWGDKALDVVKQLADPKILARIHTLRARVLKDLGKLELADGAGRDAVREATRAMLPRERADAQLVFAEVLLARGYGRRAQQAAELALDIANKGDVKEIAAAAAELVEKARDVGTTAFDETSDSGKVLKK